jgi:hypothetical protein
MLLTWLKLAQITNMFSAIVHKMKIILFISYFVINIFAYSYGQVNCDDYKIVSIFDIPPTPLTPGGNYFLLLLTLDEDNLNNIDNYANLFFVNNLGDTISIPTGPSSTLPLYSSDTIPYILQLNSTIFNQDFPEEFNGKLVIIHATQLICELDYSNIITNTKTIHIDFETKVYPNPFVDVVMVDSDKYIESIFIFSADGRIVDKVYKMSNDHEMNFNNLCAGKYFVMIQFEDGKTELHILIKI